MEKISKFDKDIGPGKKIQIIKRRAYVYSGDKYSKLIISKKHNFASNLNSNQNFHSEQEETEEEMRYRVYSLEDSFTNPQKAWFNAGTIYILGE